MRKSRRLLQFNGIERETFCANHYESAAIFSEDIGKGLETFLKSTCSTHNTTSRMHARDVEV
jgi:hypothetical protein